MSISRFNTEDVENCCHKAGTRTFTFLLVPHCQHSEYEGTEGGGEEAPPVVPHREKRRCHLDAEQHPCTTDRHTN